MEPKRKILVLTPPLGPPGGVQRYSALLLRVLGDLQGAERLRHLELTPGRRVAFLAKTLRSAWSWKPDLLVYTHLSQARIQALPALRPKAPYWVVVYGIEVWGRLSGPAARALRGAERILAISRFTRDRLVERHGIEAGKIELLPPAVDDRLLTVKPEEGLPRRLGLEGRRILLTVARLDASERYKGHDEILKVLPRLFKRVPEAGWLVVGDGGDRARLEAEARRIGVADRVVFAGAADDARLAACYRACELFVMPARTLLNDDAPKGEGFGIVFLEALSFGKPVVGPRIGAPAEVVRDGGEGILVDPDRPEELARALERLLLDPALARRMGEAGRARVVADCGVASFRRRVAELFG